MAIAPKDEYPGQTITSDPAYPQGKARNVTVSGDGTGTPWEERLVNDIFGFQQALLEAASITPSGSPDEVGASQYLDAVRKVISRSTALRNWQPQDVTAGAPTRLHGVAFGDAAGRVVAVGSGSDILWSKSGFRWQAATYSGANPLRAVAYSEVRAVWLAVGDLADYGYASSSATAWTDGTRPHGQGLKAVVDADGFFIAVGDAGTIETTPDGVTWTTRTSGIVTQLRGVAYSPSLDVAVAVGIGGVIRYSLDGGETWAGATSGTTDILNAVAWDPHSAQFIAVSEDGGIFTSDDGQAWTETAGPITGELFGVAVDGEGGVAVIGTEALEVSFDGASTWTRIGLDRGAAFDGIAHHAEDGWIIVGQDYSSQALLLTSLRTG